MDRWAACAALLSVHGHLRWDEARWTNRVRGSHRCGEMQSRSFRGRDWSSLRFSWHSRFFSQPVAHSDPSTPLTVGRIAGFRLVSLSTVPFYEGPRAWPRNRYKFDYRFGVETRSTFFEYWKRIRPRMVVRILCDGGGGGSRTRFSRHCKLV